MRRLEISVGARFGRLVVIGEGKRHALPGGGSHRRILVRCDCGRERNVAPNALASGAQTSCGCYRADRMKTAPARLTHGNTANSMRTPEYRAWCNMITRCTNENLPSWKNYGGRGIAICKEWRDSFKAFALAVGPRPTPAHSIDRENNNGNYEPGNVRWATRQQQNSNRSYRKKTAVEPKKSVKLFAFINGQPQDGNGNVSDGFCAMILSDRGDFLLEHVVEKPEDAPYYLGVNSDVHHDIYREYAPDGYTVVWVGDPEQHADVQAAYALHKDKSTVRFAATTVDGPSVSAPGTPFNYPSTVVD